MKRVRSAPKLHDRVAAELRKHISAHCRAGEALPPVRELMKTLGVSHSTLRAAQALLAQEGYLVARHGSGVYVCERALRRRVAIYSELDLLHPRVSPYHRQVARLLRDFLEARGVEAEVCLGKTACGDPEPDRPTCPRFLDDVEAGRLDGVAFVGAATTAGWGQWFSRFPLPAVGGWCRHTVNTDGQAMMLAGVEQLVAQGCRRLALLAWGHTADRFAECLAAHGLEFRPQWCRHDLEPSLPGAGWDEFREVWATGPEKPDGMLILDDVLAVDAARAIGDLRIQVPEELRLVVHANKDSGLVFPCPATRLEVDPAEAATLLGGMLLDLLDGRDVAQPNPSLPFKVIPAVPDGQQPLPTPHGIDSEISTRSQPGRRGVRAS